MTRVEFIGVEYGQPPRAGDGEEFVDAIRNDGRRAIVISYHDHNGDFVTEIRSDAPTGR